MNISSNRRFLKSSPLRRLIVFVFAAIFSLAGFYVSLIVSAKPLSASQNEVVQRAISVLVQKGFDREAELLRKFTVFRSSDNWLNSSIEKENAYAATNYPFEIMTLYPDFFQFPVDDVERAAILLHESKHLQGVGEKEAYEFVWKNREQLGWTASTYRRSVIWQNVRKQTREYSPNLFICEFNEYSDCTETANPLLQVNLPDSGSD